MTTHLWSTRLDAAESEAVLDRLDADDPDEYNGDLLSHWEAGDPQGPEGEFGFSDTPGAWKSVGKAVAEASPSAALRLEGAWTLCNRVQERWIAECDYMGPDQWAVDRAELERI